MRRVEVHPRASFARVKSIGDLKFTFCTLETEIICASVNGVFAEKLMTRSLSEENVVPAAKIERAPGPTIGFVVETVVLISAREVSVDLRDHRSCETAETFTFRDWINKLPCAQQQLDSFVVTPGKMMKACFGRECVGGVKWVRDRIEHLQSFTQVFVPTRIAGRDKLRCRVTLKTRASGGFGCECESAFEVFCGENGVTVQHERLADRFLLFELLFR